MTLFRFVLLLLAAGATTYVLVGPDIRVRVHYEKKPPPFITWSQHADSGVYGGMMVQDGALKFTGPIGNEITDEEFKRRAAVLLTRPSYVQADVTVTP